MRVAHIRQCEARPEVKLIAFSEQLIDEVERLKEALREIDNPIRFMQVRLQPDERLNGQAALQLASDANYLRSIARAALSSEKE